MGITYSECGFVALGIEHGMRMRHIFICGLPHSTIFFHIISQTARFSETKVTENKMFVLIFSTIFSQTFLILRRRERDIIRNVYRSHVKFPLLLEHFSETSIFSADFRIILKYHIS